MKTIRIKLRVQSETLKLPELRELVGRDVEVVVTEQADTREASKPFDFGANFGGWPDELDDGFEAALKDWRAGDRTRKLPT